MIFLKTNDFDLTAVTAQTSVGTANGYGVIFRYMDDRNFYRFDIGGDGKWAVPIYLLVASDSSPAPSTIPRHK